MEITLAEFVFFKANPYKPFCRMPALRSKKSMIKKKSSSSEPFLLWELFTFYRKAFNKIMFSMYWMTVHAIFAG